MADFRKWLYAFAVVALLAGLTVPASAQSTLMQCQGSANNPPIRAEDYAALAGDIFITCIGGVPTTAGNVIPKVNITVFVTNTAITSKLTDVTNVPNFNEALLIVDEAGSANSANALLNCGAPAAPYGTTPFTCNTLATNNTGTGDYTGAANKPNVFQGRQLDGSFGQAIQFIGVPINPPGSISFAGVFPTRTLRITNLRVNAAALGVYTQQTGFTFATINTTVSFNGTNFGSNQVLNVQNGFVRIGLIVSSATAGLGSNLQSGAASFLQCNAVAGYAASSVRLTEGLPNAFRVRNWRQIQDNGTPPAIGGGFWTWNGGSTITGTDLNQNAVSPLYNTESGIMFPSVPATGDPTPNPPPGTASTGVSPVGTAFSNTTGISQAGMVSQGTRLAVRLANIPLGSNPSVQRTVALETGSPTAINATGVLVLVCGTDSRGQGGTTDACTTTGVGGTSAVTLDSTGTAGLVVYEVAFSDPNALEFANVPVYVNPTINPNANPPFGGTPQVNQTAVAVASLAPFYATSTAGVGAAQQLTSSFPIPRFVDYLAGQLPITLFSYTPCIPSLSSVSPNTVSAKSSATPVTILGSQFSSDAIVSFTPPGGAAVTITPSQILATQIAATIPAALLTTAGNAQVAVQNGTGTLSNSLPFTITQLAPVITWANPADIQFGSALGSGQLNATTNVPGAFVYNPPAGVVLGVGNGQTLSTTFTPTDTVNYAVATATASINVQPAPPAAPPQLVITRVLSRSGNQITAIATTANSGGSPATNVRLTIAKIGSTVTNSSLPQTMGTIAPGAASQTGFTFLNAGSSGAVTTITLGGTYDGGSFSSTARVTLP